MPRREQGACVETRGLRVSVRITVEKGVTVLRLGRCESWTRVAGCVLDLADFGGEMKLPRRVRFVGLPGVIDMSPRAAKAREKRRAERQKRRA